MKKLFLGLLLFSPNIQPATTPPQDPPAIKSWRAMARSALDREWEAYDRYLAKKRMLDEQERKARRRWILLICSIIFCITGFIMTRKK